ncbi:hypothetical protein Cri9333_0363 [Crinalium epipsammum PCC 9333]|uniref:HTH cro/C1-type domain-containing protein n=1 Tax=Crinalium epipsammum PCC 9333 TaxID=1173022 RepID=K9VTE4_9CYAN|nr:helix-turn-helix transcriptional regulator [Crinalium epipsammum]AFZ11343.1 hypothetical protein Cri9333_0363 [Crinalium epipsammum PCC 9333]
MKWGRVFDEIVSNYGISAKDLSKRTGVSEITISRFRRESQLIGTDKLGLLLDALPVDARLDFFEHLLGSASNIKPKQQSIFYLVEDLPDEDASTVAASIIRRIPSVYFPSILAALADRLRTGEFQPVIDAASSELNRGKISNSSSYGKVS